MEISLDKKTILQLEDIIQRSISKEIKKERANLYFALLPSVSEKEQLEIESEIEEISPIIKSDFEELQLD